MDIQKIPHVGNIHSVIEGFDLAGLLRPGEKAVLESRFSEVAMYYYDELLVDGEDQWFRCIFRAVNDMLDEIRRISK